MIVLVQWWYNSNYHSAIKRSPFEAMFGYKPSLIPAISESSPTMAVVGHYLQQRQQMLTIFKRELAIAQNRMKQVVDKKKSDRSFNVGDKVYL